VVIIKSLNRKRTTSSPTLFGLGQHATEIANELQFPRELHRQAGA
jgi:hypothetical protein